MEKKSTDHRVRITKILIRKSFTTLLTQKPVENITIKELCQTAGINRGTFYTHYHDVYELLEEIENEMIIDVKNALAPLLIDATTERSLYQICHEIFKCLKDNSDLCTIMLGNYSDKKFIKRLLDIGKQQCLDSYQTTYRNADPKLIEYYYSFVSQGCIGLLRQWIDENMVLPIEEIARIAEGIMLSGSSILE